MNGYYALHEKDTCVGSGAVGKLLTIQADEFYHGGRTYFRRWNRLKEIGGGLWITKASHDFDLLYWIADKLPEAVHAHAELSHFTPRPEAGQRCGDCPIETTCIDSALNDETRTSPVAQEIAQIREKNGWPPRDLCLYNSDKDTFDHGIATVRFPEGVFAVYTVNVVASLTDRRMRISGSDGMLDGSLSVPEIVRYNRDRSVVPPEVIPANYDDTNAAAGHGGGDSKLLGDFARFVRGEIPAPVSPARASVAVAMGVAATISGESQRVVSLRSLDEWPELARRIAD